MVYDCIADVNGQFLCTFDNEYKNCSKDEDCPGSALCYKGAKWSPVAAQCACPMELGRVGDLCDAVGSNLNTGDVFNIIALIIFATGIILNVSAAFMLRKVIRSNMFATALLCFGGNAFGACKMIIYLVIAKSVLLYDLMPDGSKRAPLYEIATAFMGLTFIFICTGVLNVSVTWVHIAEKVRTNSSTTANIYRRGIYSFFALFCIAVVGLEVASKASYVQVLCLPTILYFCVVYLIGYIRLRSHMKKSIKLANQIPTSRHDRMINVLGTISRTALLASIHSYMIIIIVLVALILGPGADTPQSAPTATLQRAAFIFAALLIFQISWYIFMFARDKLHSASATGSRQVSEHGRESKGNAVVPMEETKSVNSMVPSSMSRKYANSKDGSSVMSLVSSPQ
jgi:hypothetical protein